jgi:hypothetical protein
MGEYLIMTPDENAEDPTRKETQEFDPALVDEEGIHPERGQDPEATLSELQEQTDNEGEEDSRQDGGWHTFKTP